MSNFIAEAQVRVVPVIDPKALALLKTQMSTQLGMAGATGKAASSTMLLSGATKSLGTSAQTTTGKLVGLGSATGRLDAALLGLRTAAGSAAVIGLSAGALAAIALGKAFRNLVADTANFETTLNVFQATTGATAAQMQAVSDSAKQLGADITLPSVTASDAAEAMTELAKAGLSVQDSIDGARGVLQLATAAAISNAEAVNLAASALNAFGLAGKDAARVADVFANAANLAQGSIQDVALANQQSAAVARQAGLSFEDTATFLTILARNGLRGSDAGTSLRVTLLRLIAPTKQAREEIHRLGVDVLDSFGNLRVDVFQQFAVALRDMTPAARNAALSLIFGTDAIRAASILGRQSIRTLLDYREGLREQGTAAEIAAARTKGLTGQAQALSSTLQTIGLRIGQSWAPAMESAVAGTTAFVSTLADSQGLIAGLSTATQVVTGAFAAFGSVLRVLGPPLLAVTGLIGNLAAAIGPASILTAIAAWKLFPPALALVQRAVAALAATFATLRASLAVTTSLRLIASAGIAVGFRALAAALMGPTGIAVAAGIAATGLVYLLSRENATEAAARRLKEATDALATSLQAQATAQDALGAARRSSFQTGQALDQARLSRLQAELALNASNAPAGSQERVRLEQALAVATQSAAFAQEDYNTALKNEAKARDDLRAATHQTQEDRAAELSAVSSLIQLEQQRAAFQGRFREAGVAETAFANALRASNQELRKQGRADVDAADTFARNMARRKILLADFQRDLGRFAKPTEIRFFIQTGTIKQLISRVSENWKAAGFTSAQAYINELYRVLLLGVPPKLGDAIRKGAIETHRFWEAQGQKDGESYVEALAKAVEAGAQAVAQAQSNMDKAVIAAGGRLSTAGQIQAQRGVVRATRGAFEDLQKQLAENRKLWSSPKFRAEFFAARNAYATALKELADLEAQAKREATDAFIKARDAADKKVADALSRGMRRRQTIIDQKQLTKPLTDDVKAINVYIHWLQTEGLRLARQIKNASDRADAIRLIEDTILGLIKDRQTAVDNINQAAAEARQKQIQTQQTVFQLDIQIAQASGNVAAERRAHEAYIAWLKQRINQVRGNKVLIRQYRLELINEQNALKELKGQLDKNAQALQQAEFAFLQTMQGFTFNLIGNLIPGGLTGGLVGGSTPVTGASSAATTIRQVSGGFESTTRDTNFGIPNPRSSGGFELPRGGGGAPAPPTSGQASTQITWLHRIWEELHKLNRSSDHPEAKHQRKVGAAVGDTAGNTHGM